jgi:diketogulonate reductase-like aldo/keto reductase
MPAVDEIPKKRLSNGLEIPCIGLGTFKAEASEAEKLSTAIKEAIKSGYRHIDCAFAYANESIIGKALHESIQESNGKLKREDFFIVSKLWNTFHSKQEAPKGLEKTLKDLQLNYLDLYLIHWPYGMAEGTGKIFPTSEQGEALFSDVHYLETYEAMEEFYRQGKIKAIGLSNFNPQQIQDVLDHCKIRPVVCQFEVHPYLYNHEWIDFCQKNDLQVINYSPLGASDRSWGKPDDPILLKDQVILDLAKKHNKSAGQICLRWAIQRNLIPIPKSVTPKRIKENINIFDFELTQDEMDSIKKLDKGFRYYREAHATERKLYPF